MKADRRHNTKNCIWLKMLVILFWLFLWQILAWVIGNKILLEGPIGVVKRLFCDLQTLEYYETVGASVARIMGGVFCGVFLAVILGIFSWKNQVLELFCRPVIQFLKAAPITCFVVLLLIWTGSENLAFYIALLVAFPPVYLNLLEGLKQLDEKLMEVAKVYHMPFKNRWNYIYLPGVKSYFTTALGLAVGMAFKAGVAAEIIGTSAIYVISEMRRNDDWWEKVCDAIWKHPSNNFCAFGIITICIVLVAFCIFLFNYKWCLEKADFDDIQRKKVALSLAVFTAPYWFYLPTEWFY